MNRRRKLLVWAEFVAQRTTYLQHCIFSVFLQTVLKNTGKCFLQRHKYWEWTSYIKWFYDINFILFNRLVSFQLGSSNFLSRTDCQSMIDNSSDCKLPHFCRLIIDTKNQQIHFFCAHIRNTYTKILTSTESPTNTAVNKANKKNTAYANGSRTWWKSSTHAWSSK